jgi:hypothetical protein
MTNDNTTNELPEGYSTISLTLKDGVLFVDDKSTEELMAAVDDFMMNSEMGIVNGLMALAGIAALAGASFDINMGVDRLEEGAEPEDITPFSLDTFPMFFASAYAMAMKTAHNEKVADILMEAKERRGKDRGKVDNASRTIN